MAKREVEVVISKQAEEMLDRMPSINSEKFLDWFCTVRKISAGGGDLINYLSYLKDKEVKKNVTM